MTHIPSVEETFAYLAKTVRDCRQKLAGFDTRWEIEEDGVRVTVTAADGASNSLLTPWWKLLNSPAHLPLHAGQCASELSQMREARDQRRREIDAGDDHGA